MKKIIAALIIISLGSCSPAVNIVKSWQAPGVTMIEKRSNKILVIGMIKDEATRKMVETALLRKFRGNAIASYTFLPFDSLKAMTEQKLDGRIKQDQYTYIVMMRLSKPQTEVSFVPTTTSVTDASADNFGYGSYFGFAAGNYTNPSYFTVSQNYAVETTVYTVNPNKLIWACTTETVSANKLTKKEVNAIASGVIDEMENNDFL
jgi:hypothetical protein